MSLRIAFMGTADFAVPTLVEVVGRGHDVVAVYTRAPKPAGRRGLDVMPSPVESEARRFALPLLPPGTLRPAGGGRNPRGHGAGVWVLRAPWLLRPATLRTAEAASTARGHGADVAIVVAYGLLLPKAILEAFPLGAFNLHASLLPRWRGAAPINRAIMAGDSETGVMVTKMEEGLDSGPIAMVERVPILCDATVGDLHERLALLGADLMVRAVGALERGSLT